jgi:hypothetical protein
MTQSCCCVPWSVYVGCIANGLLIGLMALGTSGLPALRAAEGISGRTFFVDSEAGRDDRDGLAAERAWQSLARVNSAELAPGDTVRFRRGGSWRGSLIPVSGNEAAAVTYTSYGDGPKPLILGSLSRNQTEDWVQVDENLWATLPQEYRCGEPILDLRGGTWRHHQEAGARIGLSHVEDPDGTIVRIACESSGSASNHVQLWGPELTVEQNAWLLLTFRARSSKAFRFPGVGILQGTSPWTRYARSGPTEGSVDAQWNTFEVAFQVAQSADSGRLHINLGGVLPADAVFEFQPQSLHAATPAIADPLSADVGNIIFDGGAVCGWKKWSVEDLTRPYDYYYDAATQRVFLTSEATPTSRHQSIELALGQHVINQGGKHHVVYDGLAVMYGAAHGFGGGNTHNLVIRNCDLAYIGGAHQLTRADGRPVRYGNAIEFWNDARDHLVEDCRIWEVYDAALTNQGRSPNSKQINITYRNNLILNSEYSFEYWHHPETAVTRNIRFVNNTCIGAGRGWAHQQRPDPNGSHLMFYSNTADTAGIEIRYNIFYDHTDWGSRYSSGWQVLPEMDFNLWYSPTGVMAYWFGDKLDTFEEYRQVTGLDTHSQFADPQFIDPAAGDYRPASDSPARKLRPDGGPVGVTDRKGDIPKSKISP